MAFRLPVRSILTWALLPTMLWVGQPGLCLCADGSVKLQCLRQKVSKPQLARQHNAAGCCSARRVQASQVALSDAAGCRGLAPAALKVKDCCSAYSVAGIAQQKAMPRSEQMSALGPTMECGLLAAGISAQAPSLLAGDLPPPLDLVIQHCALRI